MERFRLGDFPGGPARVVALEGGLAEEKRLADLGLHPGAHVEVLQHSAKTGMLVAVNADARIVLDPKTAAGVVVTALEQMLAPLALAALVPGDRARIQSLGKDRSGYRQKLMSMGLTPGVEFEITRVAPLGDPMEIRVRGFAMSLRRFEADTITVEKL
ncbi:FeoA family protein [Xanthobacter autotrophicus]|uniref:FeoA family protein n=1 Tax=Xanthobacter autotrophicus TaxID=280 RepID=UPI00372A83C2